MKKLKLNHAVHTLDNELLFPAGSVLSKETLDERIASNKNRSYPEVPILEFGTVRKDLLESISNEPYKVIFNVPRQFDEMLAFMEKVRLVLPAVEYLEYFKKEDPYTYLHVIKVFALSTLLAQTLLKDDQDLSLEGMAGPIHDFGKICVPIEILRKRGPLTRSERGALEHHTYAGFVLLSYYLKDQDNFLAKVAREHHERRDGSGYPQGIALDDRLVEIIVVTDIYDALISDRPYRKEAYDNRSALEEITRLATAGELSVDVVKALISLNRKDKPHYTECVLSSDTRGKSPEGNYGVIVEEES